MKVESPLLQESGMMVVGVVVVVAEVVAERASSPAKSEESSKPLDGLLFPGAADKRAREQEQTSFAQLFSVEFHMHEITLLHMSTC